MRARSTPLIRVLAIVAVGLIALVSACSSDSSGTDKATTAQLRERNRQFLRKEANFDERQASCVSREVTVDLSSLLSKGVDDADATKKAGYDQFARAVRLCISQDRSLTTSTTGG